MFEILQYICGYISDKRAKEKSNKNKYICIDRDMWWVLGTSGNVSSIFYFCFFAFKTWLDSEIVL